MKITSALTLLVITGLSLPLACKSAAHDDQSGISEPKLSAAPSPESVLFKLKPVATQAHGVRQLLASYTSNGKTASFRIELDKPQGDVNTPDAILFGHGRFIAETESDSSAMLVDLQKALEAKTLPKSIKREPSLPFTYATLGEHQSRFNDGSFGSKPPGNWSAMKIFITTGDDASEVFLNLNPVDGQGEFAIKDSDYGDAVLSKLASVL